MIDTPSSTSGADQSRLELAMAAAAAERANKPRWIIVLGGASLLVAAIILLVAFNTRRNVLSGVAREWGQTIKIQDLKQSLQAENANLARRGTAANPRMGALIEQLASLRGVILGGPVNDSTNAPLSQLGLQQHVYNARATNQDPENVLKWLIATQDTPDMAGLEITRLALRPGAGTAENTPGWNVEVTFSRWEKLK